MDKRIGWGIVLGVLVVLSLFGLNPEVPTTPGSTGEINGGDTAWMLASAGLVLLMTPGLGFFYGGMVNAKNLVSTIYQSFAAMGVVSIVWLVCGFSVAFGDSFHGLFGNPLTFFMFKDVGGQPHPSMASSIPFILFALFQLKFAIITPALMTGAFVERIRFTAYLTYIPLWVLLVYAPLALWTWGSHGIFHQWGLLDFAGGTVVHISAGMATLAGAMFLGPRKSHERGEEEVASNVPYVILGTGLLWFGWFGFNAGSSLAADAVGAQAFLNTNTSSSVAMITWLALDGLRGKKISSVGACIGAVVGLVAITPAAGYVNVSAAVAFGLISSAISNQLVAMKHRFPFDDALDVFACHGVGGMVGMMLTAVFATEGGLITGKTDLFIWHGVGLIVSVVFTFGMSYALFALVNLIVPIRVS